MKERDNKMGRCENAIFKKEMKKTHTILIPQMLQPHFTLLCETLKMEGYKTELLTDDSADVAQTGLKYVHNDICYPAILVIGQFIKALQSGKYDTEKTALLITQTGGGCRASNYIFLLRKALKNAGFERVPVISLNFAGLDKSGFTLSPSTLLKIVYAVLYGDAILALYNQARSYEKVCGAAKKALESSVGYIVNQLRKNRELFFKKHVKYITKLFAEIELSKEEKPRVGIVGEIYLKYSPLGNNNLEDFLISQGAEPVCGGLCDFLLYCVANGFVTEKLYNMKLKFKWAQKMAIDFLIRKQKAINKITEKYSTFKPMHTFDMLLGCTEGIIDKGVKMGEGWLLTAEMIAHIKEGVGNIICAQPFGCLPNHIVAKGVVSSIRAKYPLANIAPIDYDSGACRVNQENRIKLMLMNAQSNMEKHIHIKREESRSGDKVTV